MQFALRCINPAATAGVKAQHGRGRAAGLCAGSGNGAGRRPAGAAAFDVTFAAGQASKDLGFQYADVGAIELHLRQGGATGTAAQFVSRPWMVDFRSISRGGVSAPSIVAANGQAFAMAGEPCSSRSAPRGGRAQVTWAPNFGNEASRPSLTLDRVALFTDPASRPTGCRLRRPFAVDATSWKGGAGKVSVNASWGEVGATTFTDRPAGLPGTGAVAGSEQDVGRFYPAWFSTEITRLPPFAVPASSARSAGRSGRRGLLRPAIRARVVARGLQGQELTNFTGAWFRKITLSAVDAKGVAAAGTLAPAS